MLSRRWTCGCCGQQFETLPLDFGNDAPFYWYDIPEEERAARGKLTSEVCWADEHIFIQGCLENPIIGHDEKFVWGVWVSVSKESFSRIQELGGKEISEDEPARFGWLNSHLPNYPETLSLKTHIHLRGGKLRPYVELEPTDHPLAIEQQEGITMNRVEGIVASLMTH